MRLDCQTQEASPLSSCSDHAAERKGRCPRAGGMIAFGYGLGVAVAAVFLALGYEPRRRKK